MPMRFLALVSACLLLALGTMVGCGHDARLIEAPMIIHRALVEEVGSDFAVLAWETSIPGDSRVDFALVGTASTADADLESVSDEQYIPLLRDGGVTVPDPDFVSVSNTVLESTFSNAHRVRLDRLLPGRTYVATVSSTNGAGADAWEFGVRLEFTTNAS